MGWLRSRWHYCLRLPCDVLVHGPRRYPTLVGSMYPPLAEARMYRHVGLWVDGVHRCNLVLAIAGACVLLGGDDEPPTLQPSGNMP